MKKYVPVLFLGLLIVIIQACTSGKAALKEGDYYGAVLESVKRLRESPKNKRAKQVLTQGYPMAINYIDTNIQDGIKADDPNKWRNAVDGYTKINYINDQIRTSPGAMKVIPKPQSRFKELAEAKEKAANEAYNAGINEMMKNTRQDNKQAYFDFKDANSFQPGYQQSIEMMNQAEFNATLRVAYEEINSSQFNYGSFQPTINSLQRLFLSFKPVSQKDTVPPQQLLKIIFNGYQQNNRPIITTTNETQSRQIVVGQTKGADGKMVDQLQTVTAQITYFNKTISANSSANVTITDTESNAVLQSLNIDGPYNWQYNWATFQGDSRALSGNAASLAQRKEVWPNGQDLFNQSIRNLQSNLGQQLRSFYSQY